MKTLYMLIPEERNYVAVCYAAQSIIDSFKILSTYNVTVTPYVIKANINCIDELRSSFEHKPILKYVQGQMISFKYDMLDDITRRVVVFANKHITDSNSNIQCSLEKFLKDEYMSVFSSSVYHDRKMQNKLTLPAIPLDVIHNLYLNWRDSSGDDSTTLGKILFGKHMSLLGWDSYKTTDKLVCLHLSEGKISQYIPEEEKEENIDQ